jgi:hypothetical protein
MQTQTADDPAARRQQLLVINGMFEALRSEMSDNAGLRAAKATGDIGLAITLLGGDAVRCVLRLANGGGSVLSCAEVPAHLLAATPSIQADVTVSCTGRTFERIANGQLKPALAFFQRKVKITGDRNLLEALRSPVRLARIRLGLPVEDEDEGGVTMANQAAPAPAATDAAPVVATKRPSVEQGGVSATVGTDQQKQQTNKKDTNATKPGNKNKRPKSAPIGKMISRVVSSAASRIASTTTRKRACVACRSSRVKCDCDATKACSRCTRLGLKCVLAAPKRRGRPTTLNARNKALAELTLPPQGEPIVFDPASSTIIEGQATWQNQVRTGACSACRSAKVKCETLIDDSAEKDRKGKPASSGQCKRCERMGLRCLKNSTTAGRPLARHTRALMLPTYAPPDVTTFPGIVVSKSAAENQVAGAYPILAIDDIVRKFKAMDSRLGTNSRPTTLPSVTGSLSSGEAPGLEPSGELSVRSSPGPATQDDNVNSKQKADDDEDEAVPKTLVYWNCMMLRSAVLEESRSEVEAILSMASQLGIAREVPLSCVDKKKVCVLHIAL